MPIFEITNVNTRQDRKFGSRKWVGHPYTQHIVSFKKSFNRQIDESGVIFNIIFIKFSHRTQLNSMKMT